MRAKENEPTKLNFTRPDDSATHPEASNGVSGLTQHSLKTSEFASAPEKLLPTNSNVKIGSPFEQTPNKQHLRERKPEQDQRVELTPKTAELSAHSLKALEPSSFSPEEAQNENY